MVVGLNPASINPTSGLTASPSPEIRGGTNSSFFPPELLILPQKHPHIAHHLPFVMGGESDVQRRQPVVIAQIYGGAHQCLFRRGIGVGHG